MTQPQYIYFKVNTESLFVMGSVNVLSSLRVCVSLCVCALCAGIAVQLFIITLRIFSCAQSDELGLA